MIIQGDCREMLKTIAPASVQTCITSPPYYGLRDYGHGDQIGLEETPEQYVETMVQVFRAVRDVLKDDGTLWLNLGDSYAGSGKGQTSTGCDDPKQKKLHGMKLPVHRAINQKSSTLQGGKNNQVNALRAHENVVAGLPAKNLIGIPWRVAFALQADGWFLRQDIIWHKKNPMPESVTDRCTKAHEYIFLLSKSPTYYFDHEAIKEISVTNDDRIRDRETTKTNNTPGRERMAGLTRNNYEMRNKRSVWSIASQPYPDAHFATFPPDLIEPCVLSGSRAGDIILDPFNGSGTTGSVAYKHRREYIGIELNSAFISLSEKRIRDTQVMLF